MISITTTIDKARKGIASFIAKLPGGGMFVIEQTIGRIRKRMNVEGSAITYPVQWDSEKQRRAFFATNGFGKGIPYQRTNASASAWQMQKFDGGRSLFAPHPAGAVSGMPNATPSFWQSRIHRGRWPWLKTVYEEEIAKIPKELLDKIKIIFGESKQQ